MNFRNLSAFVEKASNWTKKPVSEKLESFVNRYYAVENNVFEKRHGLDFGGEIPNAQCVAGFYLDAKDLVADSKSSLANAHPYQAYGNPRFKSLIEEAMLCGDGFDRFVDIGCGKGKQCVYAAKYFKFDEVIGIEFSKPLVEVAEENLHRLGWSRIKVINADATSWHIPDGKSIIFMYNPFNATLLNQFISFNMHHFQKFGSIIAYGNDLHRDALEECGFKVVYRSRKRRNSIYKLPDQTTEPAPVHQSLQNASARQT